ncbi:hypothetical protein [Paenibacillus sp. YYML68]|uniref:hypothetical protein n=1 Tax=Paenibacillus sp. YYML68 TaxID=2909250 RepID=UPI002490CCEA|nr:hypothetical protein [Paenibacillus sp. YYML68]
MAEHHLEQVLDRLRGSLEGEDDSQHAQLLRAAIEELERLSTENRRLKTALLRAATSSGKPTMSTKLSEALRE